MTAALLSILAVVCATVGITLLYRSWSRRPRMSRMVPTAGWALLLIAAACWIAVDGWEFGMVYAITVPSIPAGLLLWLVSDRRPGRVDGTQRRPLARPSWSAVRTNLVTLLLVVVLGVVASTLITSAVGLLLPFGELDRMVFIVCVMPVVWGLTAFWLTVDARRLRPIVSLIALSGLSLLSILAR